MTNAKIKIEDEVFLGISEAAKFLEVTPLGLGAILSDNEEKIINGYRVCRLSKRTKRIQSKLYCKETNVLFKNATVLGKYINIHPTCITNSLNKYNKYVDKDNNVYIRVKDDEVDMKNIIVVNDKDDIEKANKSLANNSEIINKSTEDNNIENKKVEDTMIEDNNNNNVLDLNINKQQIINRDTSALDDIRDVAIKMLKDKNYNIACDLVKIMQKLDNN